MPESQNGSAPSPAGDSLTSSVAANPSREFWLGIRQSLLGQVDAIEVLLKISPRTSALRQQHRAAQQRPVLQSPEAAQ